MSIRTQPSTSSLSSYPAIQPFGNDSPNGTISRDFCNSFWGDGDEGPNALFTRMRSAVKTSEGLRNFWSERAALEEEFGKRLSILARTTIGVEETGELLNSLQTLVVETQRQATTHIQLASNIRKELLTPLANFHDRQLERKRSVQTPIEKKFKTKQSQVSYVARAQEKYEGDCVRIKAYRQQAAILQGQELDKLQVKLRRALETVRANEKDYSNFARGLSEMSVEWETDWKWFCDDCQDMEEERMELMKDNIWNYANMISTVCVSDDESCEKIRTALDQLEPDRDLDAFVEVHGTGNRVTDLSVIAPRDSQRQSSSNTSPTAYRTVHYRRVSRKPGPVYQNASDLAQPRVVQDSISKLDDRTNGIDGHGAQPARQQDGYEQNIRHNAPVQAPVQRTGSQTLTDSSSHPDHTATNGVVASTSMPELQKNRPRRTVSVRRQSQPLPAIPGSRGQEPPLPTHPPIPVTDAGNKILFLVKALYDYKATIDEEFDFQVGDIIAVTQTPDDGWWSGELLDEARREPGRHIFPSNYVCLF
ncbi:hypothetical protein AX17_004494 [Amanita inopinata Kibby_2008]|nr:hypothetical protein AX17_004494 [Amanita inopinata Kibby_2008]